MSSERYEFLPSNLSIYEAAARVLTPRNAYEIRTILGSEDLIKSIQVFESTQTRASYLAQTLLALPETEDDIFWHSVGVSHNHHMVTRQIGTAIITAAAANGDVARAFTHRIAAEITSTDDPRVPPSACLYSVLRSQSTVPEGAAAIAEYIIPKLQDSKELWHTLWQVRSSHKRPITIEALVDNIRAIHKTDMDQSYKDILKMAIIGFKSPFVIESEILQSAETLLSAGPFSDTEYIALIDIVNQLGDINPHKARALLVRTESRASAAKPPLQVSLPITRAMSYQLNEFARRGSENIILNLTQAERNAYYSELERRMMTLDIQDSYVFESVAQIAKAYYDIFLNYSSRLLNASKAISETGEVDERLQNLARIIGGSLTLKLFGFTNEDPLL